MSMKELANRSLLSMLPIDETSPFTLEDYQAEVAARVANSISTVINYTPSASEATTLRAYWTGSPRTLVRYTLVTSGIRAYPPGHTR